MTCRINKYKDMFFFGGGDSIDFQSPNAKTITSHHLDLFNYSWIIIK